jgi:sodium-dependent dicarboxylate transporter 2/3/5
MSEAGDDGRAAGPPTPRRIVLLLAGPLLCALLLALPVPTALSSEAWRLCALTAWMVLWWMTEAAPAPVTALLPIPLMPLFSVLPQDAVAANYGDPLIFLFLGGFLLAAAMQRWGLHRRIALSIVSRIGTGPSGIVAGFMLATAALSMWMSNTATAVMMLAVGLSVVEFVTAHHVDAVAVRRFGVALMLGIAYSASIGGIATLIGTPPNMLMAAYLQDQHGLRLDFARWMLLGVPLMLCLLPAAWVLLCRMLFPLHGMVLEGAHERIREELASLGRMSRGERIVLTVFVLTATLWITRTFIVDATGIALSDTTIAIAGATLLFLLPVSLARGEFVLDWRAAKTVPWGVLLLFGGGLALADAFQATGLAVAIGKAVGSLGEHSFALVLLATITAIVFLTELTSNVATTASCLPVLGAVAVGLGHGAEELVIPATLAASMAFMLPVATPPNALVFAWEGLTIRDMMKAGLWLNFAAIALIYLAMRVLAPMVLGP